MSSRQRGERPLRQGFTTGSAAAAAAKAALNLLLTGSAPNVADIPLPPGAQPPGTSPSGTSPQEARPPRGNPPKEQPPANQQPEIQPLAAQPPRVPQGRLAVPVAGAALEGDAARAWVVKDGGDDPDATHGATIACVATLRPEPGIELDGGNGVGRVTLPGLPVPPGQAAINPAPRAQILLAAQESLDQAGYSGGASLLIEVEDGEAIARHTLNPRLGIVGGISILGTGGVVKPFSHAAWRATIDSGLSVARAAGLRVAAFSTGRRSERLLMARRPELPERAFVQAADFFAHALRQAAATGFTAVAWGCYFGKLAKMAQGLEYTHAHAEPTDFALLSRLAGEAGCPAEVCAAVGGANTARHALELVPDGPLRQAFAARTAQAALEAARGFGGPGLEISICCFGFESGVLAVAGAEKQRAREGR
ncbi:cobalt-precorrin-5B (C(1))-methyltransferase CbiD [Fundidesulfovibrio agrisoli]|uniref:cobalt-precorrin-5B (C(1))-methyltransferase CbiD n=1 Tax=Fundidesulfovibrio agrisoli TaxID=2922717 RepID=UPI001FAE3155|nr:cobalt-precorrin-5B (C(1))-methyltransferase CbiD [Fundidesulfovibrio agrisoli]